MQRSCIRTAPRPFPMRPRSPRPKGGGISCHVWGSLSRSRRPRQIKPPPCPCQGAPRNAAERGPFAFLRARITAFLLQSSRGSPSRRRAARVRGSFRPKFRGYEGHARGAETGMDRAELAEPQDELPIQNRVLPGKIDAAKTSQVAKVETWQPEHYAPMTPRQKSSPAE